MKNRVLAGIGIQRLAIGLLFTLLVATIVAPFAAASPMVSHLAPYQGVFHFTNSSTAGTLEKFGPPYTGATFSQLNSTVPPGPHGCASQAKVIRSPLFDATTGAFKMSIKASAGQGPVCPHSYASALTSGSIQMASANFTQSKGGSFVFRAYWNLAWTIHLMTRSPVPGDISTNYIAAHADVSFGLQMWVWDATTNNVWGQSTAFGKWSSLDNGNTTLNKNLSTNVSLPMLVPMTQGDVYEFGTSFIGYAFALIGANTDQALAVLDIGSVGGGATLEKVTIRAG